MKVKRLERRGVVFFCPGCNSTHALNTQENGPNWEYNENPNAPTFRPSVFVTCRWSKRDDSMKDDICHSFVTDGRIEFLGDCTHPLAGKTVDVPDWPYSPGTYGGIVEEPA